MVGGFSIIPSVQLHSTSSCHTRNRRFPIRAIIVMLLLHAAALIRPMSAATAAAQNSGVSISKSTASWIRRKLVLEEKLQCNSVEAHCGSVAGAALRFHRHLLANGAGSVVGSSGDIVNQAMRALVGSSPPKCVKKCGACAPCKSVLVPIHTTNLPATPTEYYPEAWRCQCRGKIYNP